MQLTSTQPILQEGSDLDALLPVMTYRDLQLALGQVAVGDRHQRMIPYLVSALQEQAKFLTGQMAMFEILRSANCLADIGPPQSLDA
ncbi:hypothetical protein [Brevundimonas sp.]|uniref:hypothetical protein n=1 Tax=Brevundimonas sp. TaxID=1871086 RepID=UPI00260683D9|nr:hypothetical protein [Brevundimonas sp.]